MTRKYNAYSVTIEGGLEVDVNSTPGKTASGLITRFILPDGRIARPFIGIELEDPETNTYTDLSTESELEKAGFRNLDYIHTEFKSETTGDSDVVDARECGA